ncbi:peroxisomal coenzyme A diphosphatase NUDT7 [Ornithorhynchus anatinus]|uniref:Peroxisomal coenzyme A diphosphatase NUDT7 n=1 Tax=Ornithorhynchus anatinus TaxID=9258 RepID=K7EH14_ORNAN|nr:peroxisomal coenzyme A diphosphatase NUDT7 [Ornithorhynchus anatinus]
MESLSKIIKNRAKARLREFDVGAKFSHLSSRKFSVLLPLVVKEGELQVLLTVRSKQLRRSPGQVCFPGGKSDPSDKDEIATALREAQEEVGLDPQHVEVICRLVPCVDQTGGVVTPVVGFIENISQLRLNPDEVSEVFLVPLEYFLRPQIYKKLQMTFLSNSSYVHCFDYVDPQNQVTYRIWGLTAKIAVFLALIVVEKKPSFDVEYDLNALMSSSEHSFMQSYSRQKNKL